MSRGATVWITGLPGAGKSTLAAAAAHALEGFGPVEVLDGDEVRTWLSPDLGHSRKDRARQADRTGRVARMLCAHGVVVVVSLVSPYRRDRDLVRTAHRERGLTFLEAHVGTSLDICRQRDPKGLYRLSAAGRLPRLTGVDDPYEPPLRPEFHTDDRESVEEAAARLAALTLRARPAADSSPAQSALP
jgi:adenylyl-sulfate kinase